MRKGFPTLLVVVFGISAGLALSMRPWHVYAEQRNQTNQQVAAMKKVVAQHVQDLQTDAKLSSSVGREELARERGYHRNGEVPISHG